MKTLLVILSISITAFFNSTQTKQHEHFPGEKAVLKSFGTPDEVREFPKGKLELVNVNGAMIGRAILQPGWK